MALRLTALAALLLGASAASLHRKPGEVVQPELVIPGEWTTDAAEHFLFLPLTVPSNVAMEQCKVMTNGDSLLVVLTERPQEEPETQALRKYKLVVEAIKKETVHDEALLKNKLQTWFETEDDDEVKVHIQAALDSLSDVRKAKKETAPKSVSVSLGIPHHSLLELAPEMPPHALPAVLRGTKHDQHHHHAKIIKESFAVEIPYPVPTERIVMLRTSPTTLMVAMPLVRKSMEASGISTGGKPFLRIPVFSSAGMWIAGPKTELSRAAVGLDVSAVVGQTGFKPLSDD